jgi:type III pantothenate kinase
MKNILALDVGNTNITAGLFAGTKLERKMKFPTHASYLHSSSLKRLLKSSGLKMSDIDRIVISSVVPLALARLVTHLNSIEPCGHKHRIAGKHIKIPIRNRYRNKDEVGQDRLVNAFAAGRIYGTPCVIVDFGTAITFDVVSARGEYLGGLILPGIELSLSSLYMKTALLPRVELAQAHSIIGRDTVESMRGGILFGFGAMCDGLVAQYRRILGKRTKAIATGGNAALMKRYAASIQIVDEDLTLKGLALLA